MTSDKPIRVVLADDHPVVLSGVRDWISRESDIQIVGVCTDAKSALDAVSRLDPDLLVVDLKMGPPTGLDVMRVLADRGARCRIVVLTAAIKDAELIEAVRLGAAGLVMKDSPPETLVRCIRAVHGGGQSIDQPAAARAFGTAIGRLTIARQQEKTLTPKEAEIVHMVALGLRNREIGDRLGISEGTVKVHLHNIYEKLGIDRRFKLIEVANSQGLI